MPHDRTWRKFKANHQHESKTVAAALRRRLSSARARDAAGATKRQCARSPTQPMSALPRPLTQPPRRTPRPSTAPPDPIGTHVDRDRKMSAPSKPLKTATLMELAGAVLVDQPGHHHQFATSRARRARHPPLRCANPQGFYPLAWGRGARARAERSSRSASASASACVSGRVGGGGRHKAGPRASGRGGTSGDGS